MKVIDLSQTLEHDMDVYPGDPQVRIADVHTLEKEGWRLKQLSMGSHTGTHVDAPSHMDPEGRALDQLPIERFMGKAYVAQSTAETFREKIGVIFREGTIDVSSLKRIEASQSPFVVIGDDATLTIEMERELLQRGILTFTDLINLHELPADKDVMFFGVPLKIKDGDGSPIRAFAIVED